MKNEPMLTLKGVSKFFGGTKALTDIDLNIEAGKVHALVGENGAGKSTLGKVLMGAHGPTHGTVLLDGDVIAMDSPADGLKRGLVAIAQELSLMPTRTVTDNIMLARELGRGPFVNAAANRTAVIRVMEDHDLHIDPDKLVSGLPIAEQQKVEILRALSRDARLIVFDEPTARLSTEESQKVREVVRKLAQSGKAVIYVSHFLEEVLAVADTITILRNGAHVRTGPAADETRETLIEAMTGAGLSHQFPPIGTPSDTPQLRVADLRLSPSHTPIDLDICAGEIVGLSGLVGAGRSEIAHAILGASPSTGEITLCGTDISKMSIAQRIAHGIAFIPESRRDQGLMMARPIQENVGLPYLERVSNWLGLSATRDKANAKSHCDKATVKYGELSDAVDTLSGGNQQKVLFARASLGAPKLLIIDEPTRGVDVGAKRKIYDLVVDMAAQGCAILLISSEIEEIIGLCHRAVVISDGHVAATIAHPEMSTDALMSAAFSKV